MSTTEYLERFNGDVEKAFQHAMFMANIGRDPSWLKIIDELDKMRNS